MKNIRFFLSERFKFLDVKFSIYLNRRVFVMDNNHQVPPSLGTGRRDEQGNNDIVTMTDIQTEEQQQKNALVCVWVGGVGGGGVTVVGGGGGGRL